MTADPTRIIDIATGYMASKQLFGAVRIGLFRAIADGHDTVATAAAATGRPERQVQTLLDGAFASGLVTRVGGVYGLEPDAADYFTGGARDLTAFMNFLEVGSFRAFDDHWQRTVDTDEGGTLDWGDTAFVTAFMAGVNQYNRLQSYWFGEAFAATAAGRTRMLDFYGFTADWSLELLARTPGLTTRYVYSEQAVPQIRAAVEAAGMMDRASVEAGDVLETIPGGDHDLIIAPHVIHQRSDAENRRILAHLRASAAPGAILGLFDFFLDTLPQQRAVDARHAAEYFNFDGTVVYPETRVVSWLEAAGWSFTGYVDVPGSPRVLTATTV
ncbi:MAG: class I SAM-dependent methyltransferase [Microbacteriaceae bacterium]